LVPVAVTVPLGDVGATAFKDVARAITDTAGIQCAHTIVHVVANAVFVRVCGAGSTALVQGVQLVSVTVAVSIRDFGAATVVDVTRTSTNAAYVVRQA